MNCEFKLSFDKKKKYNNLTFNPDELILISIVDVN